jgi:parvulin-like peptidyl-prolyl isomerase
MFFSGEKGTGMKQGRTFYGFGCKALVLSLALIGASLSHAAALAAAGDQPGAFARVADTVITQEEFDAAYASAARNKFFHNKTGGGEEVALLQREVADKLVTRVLLLREAQRRGIKADADEIDAVLQNYERRYANSEHWKKNREQLLPGLKARHEEQNVLEQLEKSVRTVGKVDAAEVRAYYDKNPNKFTEPEKTRVSVILLKVDPSSPVEVWEKAGQFAESLIQRLRDGADFAALAKEFSNETVSAPRGGDMGYLHQGMLPEVAEEAIKKIKAGELTPPVRVLQGAAIFRLDERTVPQQSPFETVKGRAEELLKRERSEAAWKTFLADLKAKTPAQIDQARFLPLSEESSARAAPK